MINYFDPVEPQIGWTKTQIRAYYLAANAHFNPTGKAKHADPKQTALEQITKLYTHAHETFLSSHELDEQRRKQYAIPSTPPNGGSLPAKIRKTKITYKKALKPAYTVIRETLTYFPLTLTSGQSQVPSSDTVALEIAEDLPSQSATTGETASEVSSLLQPITKNQRTLLELSPAALFLQYQRYDAASRITRGLHDAALTAFDSSHLSFLHIRRLSHRDMLTRISTMVERTNREPWYLEPPEKNAAQKISSAMHAAYKRNKKTVLTGTASVVAGLTLYFSYFIPWLGKQIISPADFERPAEEKNVVYEIWEKRLDQFITSNNLTKLSAPMHDGIEATPTKHLDDYVHLTQRSLPIEKLAGKDSKTQSTVTQILSDFYSGLTDTAFSIKDKFPKEYTKQQSYVDAWAEEILRVLKIPATPERKKKIETAAARTIGVEDIAGIQTMREIIERDIEKTPEVLLPREIK